MSYEFKLAKGKILAAESVETGKKKWEAIGQVCRAEGPSASSSRTRKGWVCWLEADGLGTSYVLKGRGDAKEQGFARAAAILSGGTLAALGCIATGDQHMEGEAPVLFVEKTEENPEPVQVQAVPTVIQGHPTESGGDAGHKRTFSYGPYHDMDPELLKAEATRHAELAHPTSVTAQKAYVTAFLKGASIHW